MRPVAIFLLLTVAIAAGAADIWRWKDADGVVHYSDSPVPGAERVTVGRSGSQPGTATPVPAAVPSPPDQAPTPTVPYTRCAVVQPQNDSTFFAADSVGAGILIEPYVQQGHHVEVLFNGTPFRDWPAGALNYTFTGLYRGSYTLAVRVLDASGHAVCSGPVINFYIRQPSVLSPQSPQRPPAPRN
jgi:hypothetical protein